MSGRHSLRLAPRSAPLAPPPDRGRLLSAAQVAAEVMGGHVSPLWVLRNVPGKVRLGHVKRAWWEYDVRRWLEQRTPNAGVAS